MKEHCHKCPRGSRAVQRPFGERTGLQAFFIGMVSLAWLTVRSGSKPSRIHYPCQKAAAGYVGLFLLPPLMVLVRRAGRQAKAFGPDQVTRLFMASAVAMTLMYVGFEVFSQYMENQQAGYYSRLKALGPVGKKAALASGAGFVTIPHAMALASPHRVVSVHHSQATGWDFQCTGSGACPEYYGDKAFVDQQTVDQMVARGMRALTGAASVQEAWQAILPHYLPNEIVAIKVNFNDSIMGGGTRGYRDNDAYVDALPQVVNSVISGLVDRGVSQENIRIFDASRYVTDRFRNRIAFPGVVYYDRYGNGDDVRPSGFGSDDPQAGVDFSPSGYPASSSAHKISDVLVESDYLINIPIMKKHGGAGITLSLKNHLGTINGFVSGGHAMHKYFYLWGDHYSSHANPIVDINLNPHIKDKTVLVIGDALYAGWRSNNTPPQRWQSFGNDSPNMLFFAVDPVAVDSVMFDFLAREGYVDPESEDILMVGAQAGLGVHERWNNDVDREYTAIDYLEIDMDGLEAFAGSFGRDDLSREFTQDQDLDKDVDGKDLAGFLELLSR